MQHLDEGTIHAWLDGALSADEAARVDRHAADCADCAALVAEARGLVAGASRVLSALDDVSLVVPVAGSGLSAGSGASAGSGWRAGALWAGGSGTAEVTRNPQRATQYPQPAARRWFRPATLAAAASVILMVGSAVVLTKTGGRDAVVRRSVESAVPAVAPTSEADASAIQADRVEGGVVREGARGEGSAAAATSLRAAAPPAAPRPVPQPQVGAAFRDGRRQANESRQSAPVSGGVAGQRARQFVSVDSVVATSAKVTAQEVAPARTEPSANTKAASAAAVPVAPPAPAPAADVAVQQRAGAVERSMARRAAGAPARSERMVAADAVETQPTVRVDTVFVPGRVDTVTVGRPGPPSLRPGPARTPPVYPVTGCYVVVEGGLADTLTLTRTPAWSGVAESRWRATAPGAIGFWSQPPNGDVHVMISGALVTARIDPSTGDLRGRVQRGGASERFLARRCR